MLSTIARSAFVGLLLVALATLAPKPLEAQGASSRGGSGAPVDVALSVQMQSQIRDFYSAGNAPGRQALPPGIRRRLARGKPLPPGIAMQMAPDGLRARVGLPDGYTIVEAGLDVLLVEVGTRVVHDILRDVIR